MPVPDRKDAERLRSQMATAMVAAAVMVIALALIPIPFVAFMPGPVQDTLGTLNNRPVVAVSGVPTYEVTGRLELTTVSVTSAGRRMNILEAMRAWLDPDSDVLPRQAIYPEGQTAQQAEAESAVQMTDSKQSAIAAALTAARVPFWYVPTVIAVTDGAPAAGKLRTGDVIVKLDAMTITDPNRIGELIRAKPVGNTFRIQVSRDGKPVMVAVTSQATPGQPARPRIGIELGLSIRSQAKVEISLGGDIGGPSAGLVFALSIYDRLTPGGLLGGLHGAGTGTIDTAGKVRPIGGIQQKIAAAESHGAVFFLVPQENCVDALAAGVDGIQLVRVDTLADAISSIDRLRTRSGPVPACTR